MCVHASCTYVTIKEKETMNESTGRGTRESFKGEKEVRNYIIIL